MESKIIIGKWEAIALIINSVCTKIFLNFPRVTAETAGTAGWILVIYVSIITFGAFFIISRLYSRFEGKDLLDIGEQVGGNIGRIITGSIVIVFLMYIVSVILREFGENMKIIGLTTSPISFVTLFFIAGMIVGAYFGLETIMRFHIAIVPIIASGYLLITLGVMKHFNISNLLPIMGDGVYSILGLGFFKISFFAELILLFLLPPFLRKNKTFRSAGFIALGLSTFFLFVGSLTFLAVLPYPVALESFLPIYQLARMIEYGRFFQRVESIFVLIWAAAALLYLTAGFFFIVYTFKKTFKLDYYKPLILPFAILIFNISLLPQNLVSAVNLEIKYFRTYAWIITFVFTIILLLAARIKKKRTRKAGTENG